MLLFQSISLFNCLVKDKRTTVWQRTIATALYIALRSLALRTSKISFLHLPPCISPTSRLLFLLMIWRTFLQVLDLLWKPSNSSRKIAKWLLSSWALWKKQFMLSLRFTIMTLETTITSEFPSQNLQSDFSVNIPFKTALQFWLKSSNRDWSSCDQLCLLKEKAYSYTQRRIRGWSFRL